MKIPLVRGVIDRRILVNFRVDPAALAPLLPHPFRPKVVHGAAMAGICLIRLKNVRPAMLPSWLGISSENAAVRAAVEWEDDGRLRQGVYIHRRYTDSWFNSIVGGRIFPGAHRHARFNVEETADRYAILLRSDAVAAGMSLRARRACEFPASSVFGSLDEASAFFQAGSLGYSPARDSSRLEGLELRCQTWRVEPLHVERAPSRFLQSELQLPSEASEFDCALLMRGVEHEWRGRPDLCTSDCKADRRPAVRIETTANTVFAPLRPVRGN